MTVGIGPYPPLYLRISSTTKSPVIVDFSLSPFIVVLSPLPLLLQLALLRTPIPLISLFVFFYILFCLLKEPLRGLIVEFIVSVFFAGYIGYIRKGNAFFTFVHAQVYSTCWI